MSDFPTSNSRARARPDRARPGRARAWLIVAAVIVALWSFIASVGRIGAEPSGGITNTAYSGGYAVGALFGTSLVAAGVVWLVLYFGFTRRLARDRGGPHFLVLLVTAAIAGAPITVLDVLGAENRAHSAAVERVLAEANAETDAYLARLEVQQQEIMADGGFEPAAVARPGGVAEARRKLAGLRALAATALPEAEARWAAARARLAALPMSDRRRARMLEQFDAGFAEGQADAARSIALAETAFDELEGQLDILSRTPRAWALQNGQLAFARDDDLAAFNTHAANLVRIGEQIEAEKRAMAAKDAAAVP